MRWRRKQSNDVEYVGVWPLRSARPYGDLAGYNAERMRGLVHTDEWKELMRREQERFDAEAMP